MVDESVCLCARIGDATADGRTECPFLGEIMKVEAADLGFINNIKRPTYATYVGRNRHDRTKHM